MEGCGGEASPSLPLDDDAAAAPPASRSCLRRWNLFISSHISRATRSEDILAGALTDSPNAEGLLSDTLIPGLVLELAANGEHLRLFAGI